MKKYFITEIEFAALAGRPNDIRDFLPNAALSTSEKAIPCYDPLECFLNDISQNLVQWTLWGDSSILYRTHEFWYKFQREDNLVLMTRFKSNTLLRWDTWANLHTVEDLGKSWLLAEPQKSKFVKTK